MLSGTPTIPSAVTESTVSGWGFTKNTGTYSKPSGGIPKTDLASAVQTSLGKADSALQSYTETDPVFSASPAAGITSANITSWNNKGTYSKPSGGIPASDLADTYLKSYTETDPVFSASAAAGITSTNISTWNSKGTYSKPSGGIPKTDLASAVQTSLGKADPAFQSHQDISGKVDKVEGKKLSTDGNQSKDLLYSLGFSVSIKAPKGRQISFEKNRNEYKVNFGINGDRSDQNAYCERLKDLLENSIKNFPVKIEFVPLEKLDNFGSGNEEIILLGGQV